MKLKAGKQWRLEDGIIKKGKKTSHRLKESIVKHMSHKGLVSEMHEEIKNPTITKQKDLTSKLSKNSKQTYYKRRYMDGK